MKPPPKPTALLMLALAVRGPHAEMSRPTSLVINGGFERGRIGWSMTQGRIVAANGAGRCLEMTTGGAVQDVYVGHREQTFTAAVDVRTSGVRPQSGRGYAFVAVYQLDSRGEYVAYYDFAQLTGDHDWQRKTYTFPLHPQATIVSLRCGLYNATGRAWFDNWTLVEGKTAARMEEVEEPGRHTGEPGRVAIFRQPGFPVRGMASAPETIAVTLRAGGFATEFLDARQLSDPAVLRPGRFSLVVLPCGGSFPASARDAMIAFLRGGGGFISMGGYAFNDLLLRGTNGWEPESQVLRRRLTEAMVHNNLLPDGGFEDGSTATAPIGGRDLSGRWHRSSDRCEVTSETPADGARCAHVAVPVSAAEGETKWDLRLPARRGRRYRIRARLRTRAVTGAGFAYLAIYRYSADGRLIAHTDFAQVRGDTEWTSHQFDFTPELGTQVLYIKCGLYRASGEAWFDDFRLVDITELEPRPMNTATGTPRDGLVVGPTQIGVFDADFPLRRVARVTTAPGQTIFPTGIELGSVHGWSASGVRGENATRWIPLLTASDRYGRPRGAVGALLLHYAGFYSGSLWAFFGADDRDLFDGRSPLLMQGLRRVARFIDDGVFLHNLKTEFAAYAPGEQVNISIAVDNFGGRSRKGVVTFSAAPARSGGTFRSSRTVECSSPAPSSVPVSIDAGATARVTTALTLRDGASGLHVVSAALSIDGETIDRMETGFVALNHSYAPTAARPHAEAQASTGSPSALRFAGNYFRYGDRPLFLFGCDNYSNVYTSSAENPLWWAREHAACRDFGFEIYENLQYSHPDHRMKEEDWRRFTGMAQLTQEYGLTFMPGLLIGHNVAVSDDELSAESRQCSDYARRLRVTPRLLWYINGDYRLRHRDKPMLQVKWARFLRRRHGTIDRLRTAWAPAPAAANWEAQPFPPPNSGRWDDGRAIDLHRFNLELMRNWNRSHVAAIRAHDADHPITSEYYSSPFSGIDLRLTIDGQDVSNIGFFDEPEKDIDLLPLKLRWNDLRARGKSFGLGEYGVKTHPAWARENGGHGYHIRRSEEQAKQLFMAVGHYTFGMGGSRVQNWCLRDANQRVFPWGVFYPGPLIPKDVAYVHRNLSLLFRMFAPVYEAPPLTVLLCDNMRLGNAAHLGVESGYRCFAALLGIHADFNVASDHFAAAIPPTTRSVIWPSALCPDDETFEAVLRWVRKGGTLLTTGGPVYDGDRKLTRTDRLQRLAGLAWVDLRYRPEARSQQSLPAGAAAPVARLRVAGAKVLRATSEGLPLLTRFNLGKGHVYYYADPVEMSSDDATVRDLYRWFLDENEIQRLPVRPDEPDLHAFAQRTRTGRAFILFGYRKGDGTRRATVDTAAGPLTLGVKDRYPALAAVSDTGAVWAVGGHGSCALAETTVLEAQGLATVATLDGADLRTSEAALVFPFSTGDVQLHRSRPWQRPVALFGDVHRGAFRVVESRRLAAGSQLPLSFDDDRSTLMALVCEQAHARKWQATLNRWITSPETTPGR